MNIRVMQLYYFYRHNSEDTIFISVEQQTEHTLEFLWVDSLRQDLVNHTDSWQKNIYEHTGVALNEFHMRDLLNIEHPCVFDPIEDYDCVATKRTTRKGEPAIRSFFARQFYKIINKLSKTQIVDGARDFRMMSRQMVNAIVADGEYNRFSKGIFSWVGFKTKWLSYENIERSAGHTKWSFWKLFQYSVDGILAYTTIPLYLSSVMGIAMCGISFLALIFIFIRAMIAGDPVAGWPSLVCIITLLGGLVLMSLGIIGLYIAKIYLETKKRQLYIVREEE